MAAGGQATGRAEGGRRMWTRRRVLAAGLGGATALLAAGVTGVELVDHGVLPGKAKLDALDGACSVPRPVLVYSPRGPSFSGTFYSNARRRTVGYTLAYLSIEGLKKACGEGEKISYCSACYTGKYPTSIADVEEILPAEVPR